MNARWRFFINSTLCFASAQLLTAALHEAGHGLAAQALGFAPKIYAFYEDNPTGTPEQTLIVLAAGPLTSLVLGVVFLAWLRAGRPHYSIGRLMLFWLAWLGITLFANYLIVTPWMSMGDTAVFADILHAPVWVRYVVCLIGIAFIVALARPVKAAMLAIAPAALPLSTSRERRRYLLVGFYGPVFAGVVLTAVAGIGGNPLIVGLGLLGTLGSIDFVVAALYVDPQAETHVAEDAPLRVEPVAVALYVVMVALYIVVFSRGMPV